MQSFKELNKKLDKILDGLLKGKISVKRAKAATAVANAILRSVVIQAMHTPPSDKTFLKGEKTKLLCHSEDTSTE